MLCCPNRLGQQSRALAKATLLHGDAWNVVCADRCLAPGNGAGEVMRLMICVLWQSVSRVIQRSPGYRFDKFPRYHTLQDSFHFVFGTDETHLTCFAVYYLAVGPQGIQG